MPEPNRESRSAALGVLRVLFGLATLVTGPWTRDNILSWTKFVGVLLLVMWLFLQPFRIPSSSMEPTLKGDGHFAVDDRVFVNKIVFGPRIPFTTRRLFRLGTPKRWDIVVFQAVGENPRHNILIKRVVGLPGERVRLPGDGSVEINGQRMEPPEHLRNTLHYTTHLTPDQDDAAVFILQCAFGNDAPDILNPANPQARQFREDIAKAHEALAGRAPDSLGAQAREAIVAQVAPTSIHIAQKLLELSPDYMLRFRYGIQPEDEYAVVPEDHYLVLGDNSGHSIDGRYFGWLPADHILGRAFCVWWPLTRFTDLTGFTGTWWGLLLLFGVPGLLVALEYRNAFLVWTLRLDRDCFPGMMRRGDRLVVSRTALWRPNPFFRGRHPRPRHFKPGRIVAYHAPRGSGDVLLGRIEGLPGDVPDGPGGTRVPQGHCFLVVDNPEAMPDSRTLGCIDQQTLIGVVTGVHRPFRGTRPLKVD